jgi:hypothetical protein
MKYEGVKMQFQDEDETKEYLSTPWPGQGPQLRNPWRELLGVQHPQSQGEDESKPAVQGDGQEVSPLLANDPWNDLLRAGGIEVVDLQRVRLRTKLASQDNLDVEQALDIMQERPVNDSSEP